MNELTDYIVEEFLEDYEQGRLSRRDALRLIGGITGVALATRMVDARAQTAPAAAPAPAQSPLRVAADDPAIVAGTVGFPGNDGELSGYLARPSRAGQFPVVLVCHENRGLTAHIEDVTRRLAKAGYVGFAVDLLSREGGTAKHEPDAVPGVLARQPQGQAVTDFQAAMKYAQAQPFARAGKVGMIGFCFGGGVTWQVAVATPDVAVAVPFYGSPAPPADAPKIRAAVLAIYASNDERVNAQIPATEAAMQSANKTFRKIIYPSSEHGFHNDTSPRYNADAAKAAWEETLAWFGKYLA